MSDFPEPDDLPPNDNVVELYFHIIFWTRRLQPLLTPALLAGACADLDQPVVPLDSEVLAAGGADNHVHILARLSPDHSLQEVLTALRKHCESWTPRPPGIPRRAPHPAWNENDVAVGVSTRELPAARAFIESQPAHHAVVSFQNELKAIFKEHGFDYNERELWD